MKKGYFIALEGIDGSGKSTFAKKLAQNLRKKGREVILTQEPGGSEFGKQLRTILQHQEIPISAQTEFLLFAADRCYHFKNIVIPGLREGKIVITDRCADSSLAYQGYGGGVDLSMIAQVNEWAMQGVVPDAIFYLAVTLETAQQRIEQSRGTLTAFEKRGKEFWRRVQEGFETIFASRDNVITIDANQDKQAVFDAAWKRLIL